MGLKVYGHGLLLATTLITTIVLHVRNSMPNRPCGVYDSCSDCRLAKCGWSDGKCHLPGNGTIPEACPTDGRYPEELTYGIFFIVWNILIPLIVGILIFYGCRHQNEERQRLQCSCRTPVLMTKYRDEGSIQSVIKTRQVLESYPTTRKVPRDTTVWKNVKVDFQRRETTYDQYWDPATKQYKSTPRYYYVKDWEYQMKPVVERQNIEVTDQPARYRTEEYTDVVWVPKMVPYTVEITKRCQRCRPGYHYRIALFIAHFYFLGLAIFGLVGSQLGWFWIEMLRVASDPHLVGVAVGYFGSITAIMLWVAWSIWDSRV